MSSSHTHTHTGRLYATFPRTVGRSVSRELLPRHASRALSSLAGRWRGLSLSTYCAQWLVAFQGLKRSVLESCEPQTEERERERESCAGRGGGHDEAVLSGHHRHHNSTTTASLSLSLLLCCILSLLALASICLLLEPVSVYEDGRRLLQP